MCESFASHTSNVDNHEKQETVYHIHVAKRLDVRTAFSRVKNAEAKKTNPMREKRLTSDEFVSHSVSCSSSSGHAAVH